MTYQPKDRFFKKAKEEGFAARSVYKLEELDQKFKIIKAGQQILDLGAAPGSWSQYAAKKIGHRGKLLGIDLSPVALDISRAKFVTADLYEVDLAQVFATCEISPPFDVVLSDMAPQTTGVKSADQARSFDLCELALQIADQHLRAGGTFVCKFFHSGDFAKLREMIKVKFEKVEALKPESTRSISKEIFLVGLRRK